MKKICILGLGYIGLPTASMFATHGCRVLGVDINDNVISTLKRGEIHIHEPGLRALVKDALQNGYLEVATKPNLADVFIIAVPTPFNADKTADMSAVKSAAESIIPFLRKGNLVVLESTSPPCTTTNLVQPILERSGLIAGDDFLLVYSPERVLPGKILSELVENARVVGGINEASSRAGYDLYTAFVKGEIILTNSTTAEMVKLMENTYRDVNIAIANEFARLAERFGVDVWEAISLANRHPRVQILHPGPGVGGHCISVDPWFFVEAAPDLTHLIRTARDVNDGQPHYVVDLLERSVGALSGRKVAVLGLAYKPDVDDLRESPSVDIVRLLSKRGANIMAYEPYKSDGHIPGVPMASTLDAALDGADIVLLLVAHAPFLRISPAEMASLTSARLIVDAIGGWNMDAWEQAGFTMIRLGDGRRSTRMA